MRSICRADGHGVTRTRACAALLVFTALVTGCTDSATPPEASPAPAADQAVTVPTTVSVTEGTNMALALRPDGLQFTLSIQGRLFTLPVTGGNATSLVGDYFDAREPSYSPDGARVVFHGYRHGTWDIFEVTLPDGEPKPLTSDAFDDREPVYAVDGGSVTFASDRSGNYDIWSLELASGKLTQLTDSPADEHSPAWSSDGRLAWSLNQGPRRGELHYQSATGAAEVGVSEPGQINGIAWAPDGATIAYQVSERMPKPVTTMKLLDTADNSVTPLSESGDDVFPFRAAFVDRATVVYTVNGGVRRQPLDGSHPATRIPLTAQFTLNRTPYERRQRDHDATVERQALGVVRPVLSPDAETIAFTALGDLWLWRPGDRTLDNVTDSPAAEQMPAWSNDGQQLAYITDRSGRTELWIYDIGQRTHRHVPTAASSLSVPAWSPDGSEIAVFAGTPDNPLAGQLSIVTLATGAVRPSYKPAPPQPISWTPDGTTVVTTALAPFSSRYREGVYQLVASGTQTDSVVEQVIDRHRNVTELVVTPSGDAISYVQGATLWQQGITETFQPVGEPRALTSELTDSPSWSAGGGSLVYMSGSRMKLLDLATLAATDITPPLAWRRSQPGDEPWVLRVGRLFDGDGGTYRRNVDVTIRGNRIESIEAASPDVSPTVDASDHAAFPGLFEMHAHMAGASEVQGRTWLAYGVTSVRDPGSDPYVARERQEAWDSGRRSGPRTYITGYLVDGNRVYYSMAEGVVDDAHLERALTRTRELELDFIKTYVRLPDHWQKRVVEFAHGIGIPVSSHELYPAVAHGMDHVEHIGGTSRRGYQPKVTALGYSYDDVIRLLSDSGMGITPTAVLPGFSVIVSDDDYFDTPQFAAFFGPDARHGYERLMARIGGRADATAAANGKLLRALVAEDALMVAGTDAPFVPYGAGLHAEMRLYQNAGLSPADILRSATVKAALAAGVADDLGRLAPGMLADIVVVDGDPLADIRDADNVVTTIKNGVAYPLDSLLPAGD